MTRIPAVLAVLVGLTGCPLFDSGDGGVEDGKLYVGYFAESATNDPEDPTFGVMVLSVPPGGGEVRGQFPFSNPGCEAGADIGKVTGRLAFGGLSGSWSGAFDQTAVGGDFSGFDEQFTDTYGGTLTTKGGKLTIQKGTCSYSVANSSRFRAWGDSTSVPSVFKMTVGSGTVPDFTWLALGSVTYTLAVFDHACIVATPSSVDCLMALQYGLTGSPVSYESFGSAKPLEPGKDYLAVVVAHSGTTFQGYTRTIFKP